MAKKSARRRADLQEWARGFSLLSDPTRLGILKELSGGPKNVSALCKALGLKQPTISHHLGLLRMGRLVTGTRSGKSVVYEAEKANLKDLSSALSKLTPSK
jgi:ArsR family transcriptional regulator